MTAKTQDKIRSICDTVIFPLLLVLYPLSGWNEGVDVMDTTYALGNYLWQDRLSPMWKYAFFLPNVIGGWLSRLPKGDTIPGMNLYTTVFISTTVLIAYFFLTRYLGIKGWIAFLGEVIAIALCWCPRVILYNYLTYLLMTVGVCLLLSAVGEKGDGLTGGQVHCQILRKPKHQLQTNLTDVPDPTVRPSDETLRRTPQSDSVPDPAVRPVAVRLLLAGFVFGLNVHVRFSNLTQAAFILLVWADAYWKKERFVSALKKTLLCILGYVLGFGIPYLWIVAHGGAADYAQMIASLSGMTAGAQDYSAGGMLTAIIATYGRSIVKMWPLWVAISLGAVVDRPSDETLRRTSQSDSVPDPVVRPHPVAGPVGAPGGMVVITAALCIIALVIMYKQGVFTRSYYYYDSVFEVTMMFLILGIILCVWRIAGGEKETVLPSPDGLTGGQVHCQILRKPKHQPQTNLTDVPDPLSDKYNLRVPALAALLLILITPLGSNNYTYPVLNNLFLIAPLLLSFIAGESGASALRASTDSATAADSQQDSVRNCDPAPPLPPVVERGAVVSSAKEEAEETTGKHRDFFATEMSGCVGGNYESERLLFSRSEKGAAVSSANKEAKEYTSQSHDLSAAESRPAFRARWSVWRNMSEMTCIFRSVLIATTCVTLLLLPQSLLFRAHYSFNDGTDGTPRDTVITSVPRAAGMRTTKANAVALESLYEQLSVMRGFETEFEPYGPPMCSGILQYGNAPGVIYLMDFTPAIAYTWPDLDSVTTQEFTDALEGMEETQFPIIIVKKNPVTGEADTSGEALSEEKGQVLQDFMEYYLYFDFCEICPWRKEGISEDWRTMYDVYYSLIRG